MLDSEESLILTWLEEVYEKRVVLVEDPFAPGNYAIISIMVVVYPGKTSLPEAQSSESLVWYGLWFQPEGCQKGDAQYGSW